VEATFLAVDPHCDDAQWAMREYFAELDRLFPTGFDPGDGLGEGADSMREPSGGFTVAYVDGQAIACGGFQAFADGAEIKRMWVAEGFRGAGVGRRLLDHLEQRCMATGYHRVRLDTNATLQVAIALYERLGYRSIERYNDNPYAQRWFEKDLRPG
jgi:GNAT superfamily N-acetyltransferase